MIKMKPASISLNTVEIGVFPELAEGESMTKNAALFAALPVPPSPYGDSIRAPNPKAYPPPTALLLIYYTTKEASGPLVIRMLDTSVGDLDTAEMALFEQAKSGKQGPAWLGEDFAELSWTYPIHISIILDADDHEFFWFDPPGYDPIIFRETKDKPVNGTMQTFRYQPNKSFYDAARTTLVDPTSGKTRHVLRFVNYHRNGKGDELKPLEVANFCMDIQLLVGSHGGQIDLCTIDPDAQNQGPGGMFP
ncbi:MAG: hypothetical protein V4472_19390 [Pseudomonadota bacterium]